VKRVVEPRARTGQARASTETGQRYTVTQLAERAGVSTASIKFYLREGLLRVGDLRADKRAYYDDGHLWRLLLIRSLRELARLSIEQVRKLVATLDAALARPNARFSRGKQKTFELVAAAVDALAAPHKLRAGGAHAKLRAHVHAKLRARGVVVRRDSATLDSLVDALRGLHVFQPELDVDVLDVYLDHLLPLAEAEVLANQARILAGPESALIGALVGTVLFEPLIVALRRLAHEHFVRQLYAGRTR